MATQKNRDKTWPMIMRFVIFISLVSLILGLATFYLGTKAMMASQWAASHRRTVWLFLILLVALQLSGPLLYRIFPKHTTKFFILHWTAFMALGVFFCMLFYTAAADVLVSIWKVFLKPDTGIDFGRRSFLTVGAMVAGTVTLGAAQAAKGPQVYEVDIPLKDLPPEFEGYKIVQISDLHIGPLIGRKYVRDVVKIANELQPDLIALTGDIVDGSREQIQDATDLLGNLKAPGGTFFITGNHEYYWGIENALALIQRAGIRILLNEHILLRKGKGQVVLAGVTDHSAARMEPGHASDPAKSIKDAQQGLVKILLAHQPASYKAASQAGFHLQLSGHTHGGQFFPWSIVVSLAQRYYKGLNKHEDMWVYVSRGTGFWGPPIRFAVPSEITRITLRRA